VRGICGRRKTQANRRTCPPPLFSPTDLTVLLWARSSFLATGQPDKDRKGKLASVDHFTSFPPPKKKEKLPPLLPPRRSLEILENLPKTRLVQFCDLFFFPPLLLLGTNFRGLQSVPTFLMSGPNLRQSFPLHRFIFVVHSS